jgi:hypothetical protein
MTQTVRQNGDDFLIIRKEKTEIGIIKDVKSRREGECRFDALLAKLDFSRRTNW